VVKDRFCDQTRFDFLISDQTAKTWYDDKADQTLPERLWCRDHIRPGFHVVDCGAHHGLMSVLFSKWAGPTGKVTSYEILPVNRTAIKKNIRLNECHNVTIRPYGVGERSARVRTSTNAGNAHINPRDLDTLAITTKLTSLDDDLSGQKIDFLKIDVEGAELDALRGAQRLIFEQRPTLCLELHNFRFERRRETLTEILAILAPLYRLKVLPTALDRPRDFGCIEDLIDVDNPHLLGESLH
jgi:FkbM family methyltransferase